MTRLSDLSPEQADLLRTMRSDRFDPDEIGQEMFAIDAAVTRVVNELVGLDLAQWVIGRGIKAWFWLTEKGRKVREEGAA